MLDNLYFSENKLEYIILILIAFIGALLTTIFFKKISDKELKKTEKLVAELENVVENYKKGD